MLDVILWSLKFRYYAWQQHERLDGVIECDTIFKSSRSELKPEYLKHSTALENGRIGSVNLFALSEAVQSRIKLF